MMTANISVHLVCTECFLESNSFNYDNRLLKVRCHCYLHLKGEEKEITDSVVPGSKWQIGTKATWTQGESVLLTSIQRSQSAAEVCLTAILTGRPHGGRPVCE